MPASPADSPPRVAFVIGGVQKGGTTALAAILAGHPALALPSIKEAHLFDLDRNFVSGAPRLDRYHALWGERFGVAICGDATPAYCWWPPAAERIRAYNPAMRWVLLLRDPAARAYSQWNMNRSRGHAQESFEATLDAEIAQMATQPGMLVRTLVRSRDLADQASLVDHAYLSRGFYAQQLERIWAHFPREQTLVMRSEALRGDPTPAVDRICAFLGVESMGPIAPLETHVGSYRAPMDPATRAKLIAFFEPENRRLEALLGWDLADWRR